MAVADPDAIHAVEDASAPGDRAALPHPLRGRVPPFRGARRLLAGCGGGRAARAAQCGALLHHGDRRLDGARAHLPRVPPRREHDRRDGRAGLPRQFRRAPSGIGRSRCSTTSGRTRRSWSTSGSACRRPATCRARSQRIEKLARPPGVRPAQPEPRALGPARVRDGQPAALPRGRRLRLRARRGQGRRARPPESADRLAPGARLRPLAQVRRRPPGATRAPRSSRSRRRRGSPPTSPRW